VSVLAPTRRVETAGPSVRRRADLLLALPPLVLALLGGLLLLRRPSLWYDELYTAHVSGVSLSRLAGAVLSGEGTTGYLADVPPSYNAPYYVVTHLWLAVTGLPVGELSLRLPSLLCAVAGCALLTVAVARLGGRSTGLAAGLLVATAPLVVEYAVEARGYGLAVLAVGLTALGLVRWLDGGRLALYAVGALCAGLAHWFTLPVLGGLVLAAGLLTGRRALLLAAVTAVAALPTLALVALAATQDTAGTTTGWIRDTGGGVPQLSLQAWTAGSTPLLVAVLLAAGAGLVRAARGPDRRTAVVGACWVAVSVLLVTLAELVRPVFVPRYLLPGLLGLTVLAAAGLLPAGSPRRPWLGRGALGLLVVLQLVAAAPLVDRGPREDARGAVAALEARQVPGEPVVAVDRRAALALEHYAGTDLRADLLVPPADPPPAERVWLVRQADGSRGTAEVRPSDDDAVLRARGLRLTDQLVLEGSSSWLVVQLWTR
jgi:mannosyltransferase